MALIRQIVNGKRIHTLQVTASADDLNALKGLMVGKIEEWEDKAQGGTATDLPENLNTQKYRIGKYLGNGERLSALITIHHLDPAKGDDDVRNAVVGKFNASWHSDENAEYCELIYKS